MLTTRDKKKKVYCGGDHCSMLWNLPCAEDHGLPTHPKVESKECGCSCHDCILCKDGCPMPEPVRISKLERLSFDYNEMPLTIKDDAQFTFQRDSKILDKVNEIIDWINSQK